jgi:flagellar L-ring protein FlgH
MNCLDGKMRSFSMGDMMRFSSNNWALRRCGAAIVVVAALCLAVVPRAAAQDASLLQTPSSGPVQGAMTLDNCSYMYQKLSAEAEQRELRVNDIITVLVDYSSTMASNGNAENRKTSNLNAELKNWLKFDGKNLMPAPQDHGDLHVDGELTSQFRADSKLQSKDLLTFKIAVRVVDIQPNGNLVVEGHRNITINDEVWLQSLTGVVRRSSIGPDRIVRSDEIDDLQITKRERGFIRDSYQRGWFTEWYDKWKPF